MDKIVFSIEEIATMVAAAFPEAMQDGAELAVYKAVRDIESKAFDRGVRQAPDVQQWKLDGAFEDGYAEGFDQGQFEAWEF